MPTALDVRTAHAIADRVRSAPALPVILGLLVLGRILELREGASADESGFLVVAGQWHAGGSSLYGDYWVDRPPLLIALYDLADVLGGLTALRLIGLLAAATTVALVAGTSRVTFGRRAAVWSAVVAAALLVSPLYGAADVDGELLAAPFLALGIRAAVEVLRTEDRARSRLAALVTGSAAIAALLVKQNMADVLVFTTICWLLAWHGGGVPGRVLLDRVLLATFGAVLSCAAVIGWAAAHGSSPAGIYEATYPFRITAAHLIAQGSPEAAEIRLGNLVQAFCWSAAPFVLVAFVVLGIRRSRQRAVVAGLAAVLAFDLVSVLSGGSYWLHYLVQSVPALALAAGATSLAAPRVLRSAAVLVALSAAVATITVFLQPPPTPGVVVGEEIRASARPGDTLVPAFGDAGILLSSGLTSPYPYLWSLPSRGRDPHLTLLRQLMEGPEAPTWIVARGAGFTTRLHETGVAAQLTREYRKVATVCGTSVYLRDGVRRPPLQTVRVCPDRRTLPGLPWNGSNTR